MMVLEQAAKLTKDPVTRFAALVHDLGKATTPKEEWPKHIAHEERSVPIVNQLCDRYRIPNDYRELGIHSARYHLHSHRAMELRPDTILKLFKSIDAFRRPDRFEQFLLACEADARGRKGFEEKPYPQADLLRSAFDAANEIDTKPLVDSGLQGKQIAKKLLDLQVSAIKKATGQP